jgi:hypothetical protein
MKQTIPWILLCGVVALPPGARADKPAASRCAVALEPHARLVYDSVLARPQPELALRSVLEARVRELVFSDRLMMTTARPAAEAASPCLRILRDCTGDRC